ncbi:MAG: exodeoxyribonuclease VII small subunit [Candidatus Krumholzibacteria bacterium]|nr:exodeoxyribonuclease VII small subunit [Candidatus Krumholzibacteria bacterium]
MAVKVNFEESIERLEEIVRRLEDEVVPLEESIKLYEEGMKIGRKCRVILQQADERIKKLSEEFESDAVNE